MSEPAMQDTAIGPLPADWSVVKLATVSSEATDRNRNLDFGRADVLGVDNQTGLGPSDRLLGEDFARYKLVRKNQFAYNPMRLNVGSIGLWRKDKVGIVSPDYIVFGCDEDRLDPDYVDLFRSGTAWELQIGQSGQGSVRIRYYYRHIAEFYIPLPPLKEQQAIAHVLRTVQQAKEATAKVIAAARQLKQTLMRHLFTYGPVPFDQADRVPLKETEVGPVPEHWEVVNFEQAVAFASGQVDPKERPYSKMRHVGPDNIEEATGRLLPLKLAEDLKLISGKYLFDSKDVLYSKIRPYLRKVALPTFQGICSADMYPLRPLNKTLLRELLYVWLLSDRFTSQAVSLQDRTGIPKINRKQLQSTWMPLPPANEQLDIARSILGCDRKAEAEVARKEALDALFQTLLHNLMTGKVRVHDTPAFAQVGGAP